MQPIFNLAQKYKTVLSPSNPIETYFPDIDFVDIPGSPGWKIASVMVTPVIAAELLKRNAEYNRKLNKPVAGKYALTMVSGAWVLSPETLIFDPDGVLFNGLHRLTSVVQSETHQMFTIVVNVDKSVYKVLDRGSTRSFAVANNKEKKVSEISRILANVGNGYTSTTGVVPPDSDQNLMIDLFEKHHIQLMDRCPSTAASLSVAGVRAAACARLMEGKDDEYVLSTYRKLILMDSTMPPVAKSFFRQAMKKVATSVSMAQTEAFTRAWVVFDVDRQNLKKLSFDENKRHDAFSSVQKLILSKIKEQTTSQLSSQY